MITPRCLSGHYPPEDSVLSGTRTPQTAFMGLLIAIFITLTSGLAAKPNIEAFLYGYHTARNLNYQDAEAAIDTAIRADPDSVEVRTTALYTYLATGRIEEAFAIARSLHADGISNPILDTILLTDDFINNNSEKIISGTLDSSATSPVLDRLALAWSLLRSGQIEESLASFTNANDPDDIAIIMDFHRILANALTGNTGIALELAEAHETHPDSIAGDLLYVRAQLLASTANREQALALLDEKPYSENDPRAIRLMSLRNRLAAGDTIHFDYIDSPADGLAEAFAMLSRLLIVSERHGESVLHLQQANALDPDNDLITLNLASLLYEVGNPLLAGQTLSDGPHDAVFGNNYGQLKARALYKNGETETAFSILNEMIEEDPVSYTPPFVLGELYRMEERYREAIDAYDTALERMEANDAVTKGWTINFYRAVSYMELDEWGAAEADFRAALEIAGRTPFLLNYLGYSLADLGIKLDEAETMIREAVEAEPNNGMYVDSLGWVFFRQGRYEEALEQLERARRLASPDAEIIDHLGDAYWKTGQHDYAYEQWEIALELAEDRELIERIKRKIEVGLDKVLEEEAAVNDS